jgi:hypothetical protein
MAGAITKLNALSRPWGESWQTWKRRKKVGGWQLEELPVKSGHPGEALVAIPARLVVTLPFWVDATESETVKSIALLEVEMKGLASAERLTSDVVISTLWSEGERTLVRATVFPIEMPPSIVAVPAGEFYEPSPFLAALTGNTVHLWREFDDLVAVIVWRDQILCWETLHWPASPREIQIWLRSLLLQLRSELQISERFLLREWTAVFDEVPAEFDRDEVISESDWREGPALVIPASLGGWMPSTVKATQKNRRQKELLTAIGLGVVFLIICTVVAVSLLRWQVSRQIAVREAEIASLEEQIAPLRASASRWSQIESAADDRYYPIEMLHLIVAAMPESGVRLTAFEMSPSSVLLEGEATQVSAAAEYFQKLQDGEASRTGITWAMPPPSLQANNTARFIINGVRASE